MKKGLFISLIALCIPLTMFSQFIEPSIKWEYFHSSFLENKTFFTAKKIGYSEKMNGVFVSIDNSDSIPTMMMVDADGKLIKIISYDNVNDVNKYRLKVDQSSLNKYAHVFINGNFRNGIPTQVNVWKDSLGNPSRMMSMGYDIDSKTSIINTIEDEVSQIESFTTMIAPSTQNRFYTINYSQENVGLDSIKIMTNVSEYENGGNFVKSIPNIISFTYPLINDALYPYPMAIVRNEDDEYFILHAPDTVYRGSKFTSGIVTKHKSDFTLDTIYKPLTTFIMFEGNTSFSQSQVKFVPKALSVSKNWYAIAGEAKDTNDIHLALIYSSKLTPLNAPTYRPSKICFINSCRVNNNGVVVAVGKKPNGTLGSMDSYIHIYDPNGLPKFQDFSWGSGADEELFDVTFVDNNDVVVSGSAEGNCYIARLGILTFTSAQESIPFSSSIGFAPNPASSQTLVKFSPTTDGIATAELYDMRGMKVKQLFSEHVQRGNEYTFPAPVSDVPNGVYTVIITNGITKHHQQLQVIR